MRFTVKASATLDRSFGDAGATRFMNVSIVPLDDEDDERHAAAATAIVEVDVDDEGTHEGAITAAAALAANEFALEMATARVLAGVDLTIDHPVQFENANSAASGRGLLAANAAARIAHPSLDQTVSPAVADAAAAASTRLAQLDERERRRVEFAMRWYDRACRHAGAEDRFTTAWTALEALAAATDDRRKKLAEITAAIVPLYAGPQRVEQIRALFTRIYAVRNSLFHDGGTTADPMAVARYANILTSDVLPDLLRQRLSGKSEPIAISARFAAELDAGVPAFPTEA